MTFDVEKEEKGEELETQILLSKKSLTFRQK